MPGILKLRAWVFPLFTTDMRLCYLTAFYLVAAGIAPGGLSGLWPMARLLVSIGLYEAWGVLVNDWVDRDLDAAAQKVTGIDVTPGWQVRLLFLVLPVGSFLLLPRPLANPMVLVILATCYLLALTYSAPAGKRLKEKGAWGFIADVILEKPLPSLMLFAYFGQLGLDALVMAAFYSSIGGFTLALHQIKDYETDRAHGMGTLAVAIGKRGLQDLYSRALVPFFFATGGLALTVVGLRTGWIGLVGVAIFVAAGLCLLYLVRKGIVLREDPSRPGVSPQVWFVYTFFDGPLPTLLGLYVVVRDPAYLPIFLGLLVSQVYMFITHYRWAIQKMVAGLRG
jgi:4-hydroxybenzoate polyprenyltransferase